jgi:hypothetical protein
MSRKREHDRAGLGCPSLQEYVTPVVDPDPHRPDHTGDKNAFVDDIGMTSPDVPSRQLREEK